MVVLVESTTSCIHALETSHTASSHHTPAPVIPVLVGGVTSWYPAGRARLPSEAAQRPESIPLRNRADARGHVCGLPRRRRKVRA